MIGISAIKVSRFFNIPKWILQENFIFILSLTSTKLLIEFYKISLNYFASVLKINFIEFYILKTLNVKLISIET